MNRLFSVTFPLVIPKFKAHSISNDYEVVIKMKILKLRRTKLRESFGETIKIEPRRAAEAKNSDLLLSFSSN